MRSNDTRTFDLFDTEHEAETQEGLRWPNGARFPLNAGRFRVKDWVWRDLLESPEPLIVTGYASLDHFLDLVYEAKDARQVRVLFGHEPFPSRRKDFSLVEDDLPRKAESYWLKRRISLTR